MSFNEENIEAYLTSKLTATDTLAMEEGIKNDPLLKNEVEFQKDILESLKNSRKMQLKSRLNNIDVSTTSMGVSSAVKIAASFITVGMIGAGIYYMSVFPSSNKDKITENVSVLLTENAASYSTTVNASESNKNESVLLKKVDAVKEKPTRKASNIKLYSKVVSPSAALAVVPNGAIAEQDYGINKDIVLPTAGLNDSKVKIADNVEIGYDSSIKKELSYKFYSGKLFLSKDFEEQPYELLELNTTKAKKFYLFFDNRYYELKANQNSIARLKEVNDTLILSSLKNLNK